MLRIVLPFIAGILFSIYLELSSDVWYFVLGSLGTSLLLFEIFNLGKLYRLRIPYGFLKSCTLIALGISAVNFHSPKLSYNYFENYLESNSLLRVRINKPLKKKTNTFQTELKVLEVINENESFISKGNLLAYIDDSLGSGFMYGDELIIRTEPKKVSPPMNPGQFNYKQYLEFHSIFHQVYLNHQNSYVLNRNSGNWLRKVAEKLRSNLLTQLKANGMDDKEFAVVSALLLGQREFLDQDTVKAYSNAGAMHVLAVSGLHVGILYLVLNSLLLLIFRKKRKLIAIVLLTILWFYALLTGFSPSVLRATTMFSFVIIGVAVNKNSSIYNTLAASAFVLLILNPFLIMQVGFQLSYCAVLGIVYFQPKIYAWFYFKNKIFDYVWQISAVSIAAQLATFPLGLLYFHQFPTYFLISNLVVIPSAFLILGVGLLAISFSFVPIVSGFFAVLLNFIVWCLNEFVFSIEMLPLGLVTGVSISVLMCWLLYLTILSIPLLVETKRLKYGTFGLFCLVIFLFLDFREDVELEKNHQLVIYSVPKHDLTLDYIIGKEHYFLSTSEFYDDWSQRLFHVEHNWFDLDLNEEIFIAQDRRYKDNDVLYQLGSIQLGNKSLLRLNQNTEHIPKEVDVLFVEDFYTWQKYHNRIKAAQTVCSNTLKVWQSGKIKAIISDAHILKEHGAFQVNY